LTKEGRNSAAGYHGDFHRYIPSDDIFDYGSSSFSSSFVQKMFREIREEKQDCSRKGDVDDTMHGRCRRQVGGRRKSPQRGTFAAHYNDLVRGSRNVDLDGGRSISCSSKNSLSLASDQ
jgi:hypothetical protein